MLYIHIINVNAAMSMHASRGQYTAQLSSIALVLDRHTLCKLPVTHPQGMHKKHEPKASETLPYHASSRGRERPQRAADNSKTLRRSDRADQCAQGMTQIESLAQTTVQLSDMAASLRTQQVAGRRAAKPLWSWTMLMQGGCSGFWPGMSCAAFSSSQRTTEGSVRSMGKECVVGRTAHFQRPNSSCSTLRRACIRA
eukprot:TRINITY_DN37053_c0_g1_i1.p2 TRINITY_DN37053_c0_g1~~TRINITY_DN37053_c0_g1_i1.p2  ORF type:complete len:226 (-),score=3.16 TRINITY_DN37053_c0_g1_i1:29-619(-)